MSPQLITLIIIVFAILLLTVSRLRPDLIALMVLLALGLSGVVNQSKIFSGFSSSAVITILSISIISAALQQTGIANALGKLIFRLSGRSEAVLILLVSLFSATLSLFMNNIAAVGVLMPAVMSLARRSQTPANRLLMPLAFGTILGGMATLLTTSNIIVSGALKDAGFRPFGLLDYFPVGAPVAAVGIIYLFTLGRKLLPKRKIGDSDAHPRVLSERLKELYQLESNLTHIRVQKDSPIINKSVFAINRNDTPNLQFIRIIKPKSRSQSPDPDTFIQKGDILILKGKVEPQVLQDLHLEPVPTASGTPVEISDETSPLAEVILSPHSSLIGKSLCEMNFRSRFGLVVLGIWRHGAPLLENISVLPLNTGDALLVQGSAEAIHRLQGNQDLLLLEEDPDTVFKPQKIIIASIITILTLGFAALDILPVAMVALAGAVLLMLTGCISLNDAFDRIEWKAIFLIAGMWPLSIAINESGLAANWINFLLNRFDSASPLFIAALFVLLAMLFTQFMSGPVAPIIITPLALAAAKNLGIDPHPLALAVALGCSLAFITPLGHPVNIMVMNPGGYTFKDFFKVGWPLTLLAILTILGGLHFIWGL